MCEKCFAQGPDKHLLALLKVLALAGCGSHIIDLNGQRVALLPPALVRECADRLARIATQFEEIAEKHPLETASSNVFVHALLQKASALEKSGVDNAEIMAILQTFVQEMGGSADADGE